MTRDVKMDAQMGVSKEGYAGRIEPPRVCRRPQLLRGWGNGSEEEDVEQIFI